MNRKSRIPIRIISYLFGFLLLTIGIALSIKSNLGVSPVSSIPYTALLVWGFDMGIATIVYHALLVFIEFLILRKQFNPVNFFQVLVGVLFGFLTNFSNGLFENVPAATFFPMQLFLLLISTVVVAFGLFFYVPADIMPLAAEGLMLAVSKKTGIKFSTSKILFDVTMVVISLIICLIVFHSLGSVGLGTVVSAIVIGLELRFITKHLGKYRDKLLGRYVPEPIEDED